MLPSEEDIRELAYHYWELRGKPLWSDGKDWKDAELTLLMVENYETLVHYAIGGDQTSKVYLGRSKKTYCRYCKRSKPEVTFRNTSHALPEMIGNKVLISTDECDFCNKFFANHLDDHLGKFLLPYTLSWRISGKNGVPSYKRYDHTMRIDFDLKSNIMTIKERFDRNFYVFDPITKTATLTLDPQGYRPIAVWKAYAKMALAIMPESELRHFEKTMKWVISETHSSTLPGNHSIGLCIYFTQTYMPVPWVALLRRKYLSAPLPYMVLHVGISNLIFQSYLPICSKDFHHYAKGFKFPKLDFRDVPFQERTGFELIDLNNDQMCKKPVVVKFSCEHEEEIDRETFMKQNDRGGF